MKRRLGLLAVIALTLMLSERAQNVRALTLQFVDSSNPSDIKITVTGTTDDDGSASDYMAFVFFNSDGQPFDNQFWGCPVGDVCDFDESPTPIFNAETLPVTVKVYDISYPPGIEAESSDGLNFALAAPLLSILNATTTNAITWFNPGDGRINGQPGDRLAVWCNTTATPPNVVIYGVGDNATNASHGFLLGKFAYADLLKAGQNGVTLNAGAGNGTISLQTDGKGDFWAAWNGGNFSATGQGNFAKWFNCQFS